MKYSILLIISFSLSAFSITQNTEDLLSNNLSASAGSVENSLVLSQEEMDDSSLEEQQIAEIVSTLKEMNEI